MEAISLCGLLGFCAWEDFKTKQVRVGVTMGLAILGVFFHLLQPRITIESILGGVAVGVVLYLISVISKEQIGKGDALVFMATGVFLGFWGNMMLLWSSFFLAGVVGSLYGFWKKKPKQTRLPFLPFVFVCMLGQLAVGGIA